MASENCQIRPSAATERTHHLRKTLRTRPPTRTQCSYKTAQEMEEILPPQVVGGISTTAQDFKLKQNHHLVVKVEPAEVSSLCSPPVSMGESSLLRHAFVIKSSFKRKKSKLYFLK